MRPSDVFVGNVLGCDGGQLILGPDSASGGLEVDPDGDGVYYTHSGSVDSESFAVPARLRVTYTGSAGTCAFDLISDATGSEIDYVSGLGDGGFKRVFVKSRSVVFAGGILGCDGGELIFGPDE